MGEDFYGERRHDQLSGQRLQVGLVAAFGKAAYCQSSMTPLVVMWRGCECRWELLTEASNLVLSSLVESCCLPDPPEASL